MQSPLSMAALGALLAIAGAACDKPGSSASPSASTTAEAPAAPTPSQAEPPPPPPDDLDVDAARAALKCPSGATTGACGVLGAFASCTAWDPVVPSGDGRWLGRATVVENGKAREAVAMLRARRVPSAEVAPGQLLAKLALAELPRDDDAYAQADKAIRALERADVPGRSNAAIERLKTRTEWSESFAARTAKGQVRAARESGLYACQGPKRQVFVVERAGAKTSADGLYAEVWPATW
jgi:hypothetical protein